MVRRNEACDRFFFWQGFLAIAQEAFGKPLKNGQTFNLALLGYVQEGFLVVCPCCADKYFTKSEPGAVSF